MKKAFVFLAPGFEETEAVATVDLLLRGGIDTSLISITDEYLVQGAHGIKVAADELIKDVDFSRVDALVLPGGMPGAANLKDCDSLAVLLRRHHARGGLIAAICAAPLVLGGMGFLKGRRATCYPGFEDTMEGATVTTDAVAIDGHIITGKGPGLVFPFALAIIEALLGKEAAREVADGLLL